MDTSHTEIKLNFSHIPTKTKQAFDLLSKQAWLKDDKWYLAGGTALTLQCDLRESYDLDFFTPQKNIELNHIERALHPNWVTTNRKEDTLYGELNDIKVSFISYPFFTPVEQFIEYGFVKVVNARDIAVMKIIAISQRGRKRDFFDLYWYILNREPLLDVFKRVDIQYPNLKHNYHHIIKSLTFFEDAEEDPDPQIFFDATWEQVKKYFLAIIPSLADNFL